MTLQEEIRIITTALSGIRTPAAPGEYDLHAEVSAALTTAGIGHSHEYRLAPRCRIDFLAGRIGIEIKKGRPVPSELREQLARYLTSEELDAIIVVAQRAGVPLPLVRIWGTSNICRPPMSDVMST